MLVFVSLLPCLVSAPTVGLSCPDGLIRYGKLCVPDEGIGCTRGWIFKPEKGGCLPTCDPDCGHGTCVDVNECTCSNGYELREGASPRCVPACRDCHGECVAPNMCWCREPYRTIYMMANNTYCPCRDDCETKCSKTVCVAHVVVTALTTDSVTTTEINIYDVHHVSSTIEPNGTATQSKTTTNLLLPSLLYLSVGIILMLLMIIVTLVYNNPGALKYFRGTDRTNKNNISAQNNQHHSEMDGVPNSIGNLPSLIIEEAVYEAIPDQPLQYDYVQVPAPISQRYREGIPIRR